MADGVTPKASEVLNRIRSERFTDVPVELVEAVYALEHERQLEEDREPTRAQLRHLVRDATAPPR